MSYAFSFDQLVTHANVIPEQEAQEIFQLASRHAPQLETNLYDGGAIPQSLSSSISQKGTCYWVNGAFHTDNGLISNQSRKSPLVIKSVLKIRSPSLPTTTKGGLQVRR
jgi:hypothetical protein